MWTLENLKQVWARNKPIIISVFISVIEIALFLYFSLSGKSEDTTLIKALQPYLGGYITALVTTWYVIFTYFILKTSVDMRNFNINPFLKISWDQNSNLDNTKMVDYDYISKYSKEFFGQESDTNYEDKRYIKLKINSTRYSNLNSLSISLRVDCTNYDDAIINQLSKALTLQIDNININQDESFSITILDLANVPDHFKIKLILKSFAYMPKNSKEQIIEYFGNDRHETKGICKYELIPTPQQDNTR